MVAGLDDVVGLAYERFDPPPEDNVLGALGGLRELEQMGGAVDLLDLRSVRSSDFLSNDPMDRMFATRLGDEISYEVGNEDVTQRLFQRLALDTLVGSALNSDLSHEPIDRMLLAAGSDSSKIGPVAIALSRELRHWEQARVLSEELREITLSSLHETARQIALDSPLSPDALHVLNRVIDDGDRGIATMMFIGQPQIIISHQPKMVPLCVPEPRIALRCNNRKSTGGIFCSDEHGAMGVTGCFHGCGPAGTLVEVAGTSRKVVSANEVQDIVFVECRVERDQIKQDVVAVLDDREPTRGDRAEYEGATSGHRETRIFGADYGLLRPRPTVQLRVQTTGRGMPEAGDSGAALIDENQKLIGFAFERTAYEDDLQFADWIWAANALRALNLDPVFKGEK